MFSWEIDSLDENNKILLLYRHQRIIDEKLIKRNDHILDIGGWGKLSHRLYQEECNVFLLNIDLEHCKSIRKQRLNTFNIISANALNIPFINETFDVITCFETIEHIKNNRDILIKEIFRVLKNNGIFVGTLPIPGICHPMDDSSIIFCEPNDFKKLVKKYIDINSLCIEKTGSVSKSNGPSSWYFKCVKNKGW